MLDPVTDAKRKLYYLLLVKSREETLTAGELDIMMLLSSDPDIQKLLRDAVKD